MLTAKQTRDKRCRNGKKLPVIYKYILCKGHKMFQMEMCTIKSGLNWDE